MSSAERCLIGIDVGSGSAKVSAFSVKGTAFASATRAYSPDTPRPGVAEYDPEVLWDAVLGALNEVVAGLDAIAVEAISVDAMMSGAVAISARGDALGPYTTTLDTRFVPDLQAFLRVAGERARILSGSNQPTLAPKLAWTERELPEVARHAERYVLAGPYITGRLCRLDAEGAYIDRTSLWTTGLADTAQGRWSSELIKAAGVDPGLLPRIVESTTIVGKLDADVARAVGLPAGIPVIAGAGDQSAGYVGAGVARSGAAADSSGTYAVVAAVVDEFRVHGDPAAPDCVPVASGRGFNVQSIVIGGGLSRQWAARVLGIDASMVDQRLQDARPGANGVRFAPHLGGEAYPARPDSRGAWTGLEWAHDSLDLYQAALEGIALSNAIALDRMRAFYPALRLDAITVFGGGARSAAWNQMKADMSGVPYESLGDVQITALGAAMLAAQGVGILPDATEACARIRKVVTRYEPRADRAHAYNQLKLEHGDLVEHLARWDMSRRTEWSAPGAPSAVLPPRVDASARDHAAEVARRPDPEQPVSM